MPNNGPGLAVARRVPYDAQSLLEVAVGVFNQRGYDGTSMADLAAAAGIGKSSIYHHFRGKEELLRTAVARALDALFGVLEEEGATKGPAEAGVRHVLIRTAEVLMAELPYVTLLLRVRGNTPTERWALDRRREFDRRVAAMVGQAAAGGALRSDIDPHLATRLLFGMVNSITEWYRADREEPSASIARAVAEIAFAGLRSPPGQRPGPAAQTAGSSGSGTSIAAGGPGSGRGEESMGRDG